MASAPTTPSCASRGIHSCIRPGSSVSTSRHSPASSCNVPSDASRGRATRWIDDVSAADPCSLCRAGRSVSIGQDAVTVQPASTRLSSSDSQLLRPLVGEDDNRQTGGTSNTSCVSEAAPSRGANHSPSFGPRPVRGCGWIDDDLQCLRSGRVGGWEREAIYWITSCPLEPHQKKGLTGQNTRTHHSMVGR